MQNKAKCAGHRKGVGTALSDMIDVYSILFIAPCNKLKMKIQ